MHASLTSTIVEQRQSDRRASAARQRLLAEATVQRSRAIVPADAATPAVATGRRHWLSRRLRPVLSAAS